MKKAGLWIKQKITRLRLGFTGKLCIFGLFCMVCFTIGIYLGLRSLTGHTQVPQISATTGNKKSASLQDHETTENPGTFDEEPVFESEKPDFEPEEPVDAPLHNPGKMIWPLSGPVVQNPGWYFNEALSEWRYYPGVDVTSSSGMDVKAVLDGVVAGVLPDPVIGDLLVLEHGSSLQTKYGYIEFHIEPGSQVKQGDVIGVTTGQQLHFQVIESGNVTDPLIYLKQHQ